MLKKLLNVKKNYNKKTFKNKRIRLNQSLAIDLIFKI